MAKVNKVSAIKKYFAAKTPGGDSPKELETPELSACAKADKEFYLELGRFCVAECERMGIEL